MWEVEEMPTGTNEPLVVMCREAVWRIQRGQTGYDEELDLLCERLGEKPENVRPVLDRVMNATSKGEESQEKGRE